VWHCHKRASQNAAMNPELAEKHAPFEMVHFSGHRFINGTHMVMDGVRGLGAEYYSDSP